jgi:hypothetical protein
MFTDPFTLPINPIWEYIMLGIIGVCAFSIGWDASPGGVFGSIIHWVVRFIAFTIIWAIVYGVIVLFQWIFAHWIWSLIIVSVILVGFLIAIIIYRHQKKHKRSNHD